MPHCDGSSCTDVSVMSNVITGGDGVAVRYGGHSLNDNPIVESPLPDIRIVTHGLETDFV